MPVSLPASEMQIHSIDCALPINSNRLSRGLAVSNFPGNPFANSIPAFGFFGVLTEDQLPNLSGAVKSVQLPCCNMGLVEVFVSVAVTRGAALTIDGANAFVPASVGQKAFARAQKAALAGTYVLALVQVEGTL